MAYIIGEIGQNHNGSLDAAIELTDMAKVNGMNAIKITIRDLGNEMTDKMANTEYKSPHSYGNTYMEHREKLELYPYDYKYLVKYAKEIGLDVVVTLCSETLLEFSWVKEILKNTDYIKIASRDINNRPLLKAINNLSFDKVILSTGLSQMSEVSLAVNLLNSKNLIIMHCVSKYPHGLEDAMLMRIKLFKDYYSQNQIGYSCHLSDYKKEAIIMAKGLGADFFEVHITLDKLGKGSDHHASADAIELKNIMNIFSKFNSMLDVPGYKENYITFYREDADIQKNRFKLMRSVCTKKDINKGVRIGLDDLCALSPGDGINALHINMITGTTFNKDIKQKTKIDWDDIH